jgi:hypothetical protein
VNLVPPEFCIQCSMQEAPSEWLQILQLQRVATGGTRIRSAHNWHDVTGVWHVTNRATSRGWFSPATSDSCLEKRWSYILRWSDDDLGK